MVTHAATAGVAAGAVAKAPGSEALRAEVAWRRTFAIISHPDPGKTTLSEKFLLYAGQIAEAGAVRGRTADRAGRRVPGVCDWLRWRRSCSRRPTTATSKCRPGRACGGGRPGRRAAAYYGWVMVPVAIAGVVATSPGQTYGSEAFNESFRADLRVAHSQLVLQP